MEGALDTATAAINVARAAALDLGTARAGKPLPLGFALGFAFILGIAGFARAAVCADSKSMCSNGVLATGTRGGGKGRWLEEAGRATGVLGTGGRNGARSKRPRVFGKILRSCSSDGSVLGAGRANALGKCVLMYLLIPAWSLEKPSSLKAPSNAVHS